MDGVKPSHFAGLMFLPWQPLPWAVMTNNTRTADNWRARWEPVSMHATQADAEAAMREHNDKVRADA
jgi:hypothetical protein